MRMLLLLGPLLIALFACSGGSERAASSITNSLAKGEAVAIVQTWLAQRHVNGTRAYADCLGLHQQMDHSSGGRWEEQASPSYTDVTHSVDTGVYWVWRVFPTSRSVAMIEFNEGDLFKGDPSDPGFAIAVFSGC